MRASALPAISPTHFRRRRRRSASSFAGCYLSAYEQFVIEIKETVVS
jgi:hypothetical protein